MTESDSQYFERRAREEREAAKRADNPTARAAHVEMASRFGDMAAGLATDKASAP